MTTLAQTLDGASAAAVKGDWVCKTATGVTRATSAALALYGYVYGCCVSDANPGTTVHVCIDGAMPSSLTGLASSSGKARVNGSTARAERVASLSGSDYPIGDIDSGGTLDFGEDPEAVATTADLQALPTPKHGAFVYVVAARNPYRFDATSSSSAGVTATDGSRGRWLLADFAVDYQLSARAAATGSLNLGAPVSTTQDGVICVENDVLFCGLQNEHAERGLYKFTNVAGDNGTLVRIPEFDDASDVRFGRTFTVALGETYGGTSWMHTTTTTPIVVGTTPLTFGQLLDASDKVRIAVSYQLASALNIRAAITASIANFSAVPVVQDTVTLVEGDLILYAPGISVSAGVYIVGPVAAGMTALNRAPVYESGDTIQPGIRFNVREGTSRGEWTNATLAPALIGTDALWLLAPGGDVNDNPFFLLTSDPRPVTGATGAYTEGTILYNSSIDSSITNLQANYTYDNGLAAALGTLPVLVVMHGYGGSTSEVTLATRRRLASYGLFVLVVGKRTRDASGREIHDLLDAVADLRATFPSVASADRAGVIGYSGGGANALACAHKAPDFFTIYTSFFGISDYGYDTTDGWWFTRGDVRSLLITDVGDRDATTAPYRARDAVGSIAQCLEHGGYLYMFHDTADADVTVANSRRVRDALADVDLTNFSYAESTVGDALRWEHGFPDTVTDLVEAEWRFARRAAGAAAWSMPVRGNLRVAGWHKNKRFEVWLGPTNPPKTSATGGLANVADVEFDVLTGEYNVTPITPTPFWIQIIQGALQRRVQLTTSAPVAIEMNTLTVDPIGGIGDLAGNILHLTAAAGVTLAGSDVSAWADQSGAGNNYADTGGTNRPAFAASFEGAAAVRFDQAASERLAGPALLDPNADYTIAFVIRPETTGFGWTQCNSATSGTEQFGLWQAGSANAAHIAYDGSNAEAIATNSSLNAWHIYILRRSGGVVTMQIDNGVVASVAAPSGITGTNRSALGARCDSPGFWNLMGMSLRAVAAWQRALSTIEVAQLRGYWQSTWPSLP